MMKRNKMLNLKKKNTHKSSSDNKFDKPISTVEDETIKNYQELHSPIEENLKDVPAEETLLYKRAPRGREEIDGSTGLKKKDLPIKMLADLQSKLHWLKKLLAKAKKKSSTVPVHAERSPKKFILPSVSV
ncbi:unnamed protein product, partial [Meganyctiphanes norvegica]